MNMDINKEIHNKIENLNFIQNIQFAIFCTGRVIELYKEFDQMIKDLKLELLNDVPNGYLLLFNAYSFVKNGNSKPDNIESLKNEELKNHLDSCDKCMPDDDDYGGFETTIAQYTASSMRYTLSYILKKDSKYIKYTSDALIEIINTIVSENYSSKYSNNVIFEEKRRVIVLYYQREIEIQNNIIDKIITGLTVVELEEEISKHKIYQINYSV
jgi:hypothetical protein